MTIIADRAADTIGGVTLVCTTTVEHTVDFVLHKERTLLRVGANDILDLTTTTIAHTIAS